MLHNVDIETDVDGKFIPQQRRTPLLIYRACTIQVDGDNGQVSPNCLLYLPSHELVQVSRVFADQENEHFRVPHALGKLRFDGRLLTGVASGIQVVCILKVEVEPVVLCPRLHEAVVMHVSIAVKRHECLIPVWHICRVPRIFRMASQIN